MAQERSKTNGTSITVGDKVTFEGGHYISLIDANVWSPAVYPQGWEYQGPA